MLEDFELSGPNLTELVLVLFLALRFCIATLLRGLSLSFAS